MTLRFFALNDDKLFASISALTAPLLSSVEVSGAHEPRVQTLQADNPDDHIVVLQMSGESHDRPQLQLLYWPKNRDALILTRQSDRRSRSYTIEVMIDLMLAHSRLYGLDGSSVSYGDRSIIFTGRAGSGKTSLTLSAIRRGARFISDDISVICPNRLVLPLVHKEMTLRSSTVNYLMGHDLLRKSQTDRFYLKQHGETYRYPSDIFPDSAPTKHAALAAIVFPSYSSDVLAPRIARLSAREAIRTLLERTDVMPWIMRWEDAFNVRGKQSAVWGQIASLVTNPDMAILALTYGDDLDHAEECLRDYVADVLGWPGMSKVNHR